MIVLLMIIQETAHQNYPAKLNKAGNTNYLNFSHFDNLFDNCSLDDNKRDCSPKLSGKIEQGGK